VPSATTTFTVRPTIRWARSDDSVTVTVVDVTAVSGPDVSVDPTAPVPSHAGLPGYTYAWTCDRPTCALSSLTTLSQPRTDTVDQVHRDGYQPGGCVASGSTMVWVNLSVSTTPRTANRVSEIRIAARQFSAGVLASSISSDT